MTCVKDREHFGPRIVPERWSRDTAVRGTKISFTEAVYFTIRTEISTKDLGKIIKDTEKERWSMQMVIFLRVNGKMV